jgi:hypothetical protein
MPFGFEIPLISCFVANVHHYLALLQKPLTTHTLIRLCQCSAMTGQASRVKFVQVLGLASLSCCSAHIRLNLSTFKLSSRFFWWNPQKVPGLFSSDTLAVPN